MRTDGEAGRSLYGLQDSLCGQARRGGRMRRTAEQGWQTLPARRDTFYKKLCKARLQPVLDTIQEVHRRGIWLEVTTLVIPGQNDSEAELRDIAGFLASVSTDIPWHISAFHPAYQMKDTPRTSRAVLEKA